MISHRRVFLKHLGFALGGAGLISSLPLQFASAGSPGGKLPRSSPEAQGVRSEGILDFLRALASSKHEFHSFMMMRRGQVIAQGWWSPYQAELNHMLYSLSKSFTSTAIGLARTENKLNVDDAVISFFQDKLPADIGENLRGLKLKDLLTMSVGHGQDSTPSITKEEDWVKAFLALPIPNQPGTRFLYNSGATYMLSAIIQKVTGQKVIDYLTPRLFVPLGIEKITWEICPKGINTGGWGLSLPTEALAKFGQLYLQEGNWNRRQVLPAQWVEEATTFKIQQPGTDLEKQKRDSDWHQGYCYQFWRCRHNGFRGDGAFGQFTIVLPEQEVVIAITSESSDMQGEMNLVWEHLLPAIRPGTLRANKPAANELTRVLAALALNPTVGNLSSPVAARISNKTFLVDGNDAGIQALVFGFAKDSCKFTLREGRGSYDVSCGLGKWIGGETTMPGTPPKLTKRSGMNPSKVAASGAWTDDKTFEMTWRFVETPHHDTVTCRFDGDQVRVEFLNSVTRLSPSHKEERPTLVGKMSS